MHFKYLFVFSIIVSLSFGDSVYSDDSLKYQIDEFESMFAGKFSDQKTFRSLVLDENEKEYLFDLVEKSLSEIKGDGISLEDGEFLCGFISKWSVKTRKRRGDTVGFSREEYSGVILAPWRWRVKHKADLNVADLLQSLGSLSLDSAGDMSELMEYVLRQSISDSEKASIYAQYVSMNIDIYDTYNLGDSSIDSKRDEIISLIQRARSDLPVDQKMVHAFLDRSESFLVNICLGKKAPNVQLVNFDGVKDSLENYRGKVILLDFWATWCGACIAEFPHMEEFREEMKDRPFEIISVSVDDDINEAISYRKSNENMPWVVWYAGPQNEELDVYNLRFFPTYILLDGEGNLISRRFFGDRMKSQIRSLVESLENGVDG